jgi:hypothetical protein
MENEKRKEVTKFIEQKEERKKDIVISNRQTKQMNETVKSLRRDSIKQEVAIPFHSYI